MQRTGIWIDGEDSPSPEVQAEAELWKAGRMAPRMAKYWRRIDKMITAFQTCCLVWHPTLSQRQISSIIATSRDGAQHAD